ncbi:UDP-glycosyltransferase UGT5-like [Neocloeon triangulifer]|uniref:UDP-glycosyltransferase UGT5-like n=1 Tax=Neocloeon triangulifer TaxID=2078957 RepID=UPI00286F4F74|nr:UDP-glycosyltransferase UGT5-like [Neocloeon triangulifer]
MTGKSFLLFLLPAAVLLGGQGDAARILGFFPVPGKSHMIVFSALTRALAERGHELVVVSTFPLKDPPPNYTDVNLWDTLKHIYEEMTNENLYEFANMPNIVVPFFYWMEGVNVIDLVLHDPNVTEVINDKKGFDLILAEDFMSDATFGLSHHFKAPLVLISSMGGFHMSNYAVGNEAPASYVPNAMLTYGSKMTFCERLVNTLFQWYWDIGSEFYYFPMAERLKNEIFPGAPSIHKLRRSASLVLLNNHFSLNYPRPLVPNLIEVGGMHVKPPSKPLPKDIQEWLDGAKDGAIYFSMGSNLKGTLFPEEQRKALVQAFADLPQRILWKWETDSIPDQPKNVKVATWMPQQEILAHPNVKLFITHGGLLGAQEAMYHGIPLIGIPVFGDQHLNVKRAEQSGYGLKLDLNDINKRNVLFAIHQALHDNKISVEAKRRSKVFHDQPETPLERAIFWVEYVLRHKGAPHLRSASLDLHWTQVALLDVYAVIILFIFISLFIPYFLVKKICCKSKANNSVQSKKKKQ